MAPTSLALVDQLLAALVLPANWRDRAPEIAASLPDMDSACLLQQLIQAKILTPYQVNRIEAGAEADLIVGNYRLLTPLDDNPVPEIFRGEHLWLRHAVTVRFGAEKKDIPFTAVLDKVRESVDQGIVVVDAGRQGSRYYFISHFPTGPENANLTPAERATSPTLVVPPAPVIPTPAPLPEEHERRVLIVDDEPSIRHFCRYILETNGIQCDEAANGVIALNTFHHGRYDLVLLDIDMPEMSGLDVCRQIRKIPGSPHLKVVLFSGRLHPDNLARMLQSGADDFLTKPFTLQQLQSRVQAALQLKTAQERSDKLNRDMLLLNRELEVHLRLRNSDLVEARNALVLALAKLSEFRDNDTGAHLLRLQVFSRRLAEEALTNPVFSGQMDRHYIDMLACCAPLHDIGKVGLPDHILLKPSKLDAEERHLMETHTTIGAETLRQVAEQHNFALAFLGMAIDITRHHHERYDGMGYPDHLAGTAIPLSARIVAVCDVYDALRSRRVYKPALPHETVVPMIIEGAGSQFDPALVECFQACAADFERIYNELAG